MCEEVGSPGPPKAAAVGGIHGTRGMDNVEAAQACAESPTLFICKEMPANMANILPFCMVYILKSTLQYFVNVIHY